MTIQDTFTPVFLPADLSQDIAEIVQRTNRSVVQVRSEGRGGGAGFVWRADGQVITNHHVVGNLNQVEVLFPDGTAHTAKVVARNQTLDVALLRLDRTDLPTVPIADSSRLRLGELVIAIGHPWGQPGVVTMGIVSGIGEIPINDAGRKAQYIRSDVRLAPGNSGGPLLNARGEVIGINAMIFGGDLSVAIPSHVATAWAEGAETRQPITLGVQLQPVEVREVEGGRRSRGLLIVGIGENSLAERSGLLVGDVLLEANGTATIDPGALRDALSLAANTSLSLRILRGGAAQVITLSTGN